jgi:hypothetical protein
LERGYVELEVCQEEIGLICSAKREDWCPEH